MLGPLPPLHRFVVCVLALVTPVGAGAWIAWSSPGPLLAPAGAAIGAAFGLALVVLLLRDADPSRSRTRRPR